MPGIKHNIIKYKKLKYNHFESFKYLNTKGKGRLINYPSSLEHMHTNILHISDEKKKGRSY